MFLWTLKKNGLLHLSILSLWPDLQRSENVFQNPAMGDREEPPISPLMNIKDEPIDEGYDCALLPSTRSIKQELDNTTPEVRQRSHVLPSINLPPAFTHLIWWFCDTVFLLLLLYRLCSVLYVTGGAENQFCLFRWRRKLLWLSHWWENQHIIVPFRKYS